MLQEAKRLAERWERSHDETEQRRARAQDFDIDLALRAGDWVTLWSLLPRSEFAVSLAVRQLKAEVAQDYDFIVLNGEKNKVMTARAAIAEEKDEYIYAALGYTLHNLYNAFEGYFFRIAKFFENDIADPIWHRGLLERMTLNIEGVRPALVDIAMSQRIEELLKFRRVFRNIYKSPLVPAKVEFANKAAQNLAADFSEFHLRFLDFLQELILELDAEGA
ncbi:MAG: hypothetical protein Q8M76_07495 [Spirochaetaceae bacterium]|nr:hypothetical protein [Spirochaetaceae bacterium]